MRPSPTLILRVSLTLLIAAMLGGLAANLQISRQPVIAADIPVRAANSPLRFLIVSPAQDHPFWTEVHRGASAAAATRNVTVELQGARRASVEEQVQLIDMAAAAQVDGIITQGAADPALAEVVAKAADRGIPVITVETDMPAPDRRLAYVGSDNYQAGRLAAEELILRTGGRAVVGVVRGHLGSEADDLRLQGFRDALAVAPEVQIVAVMPSQLNRSVAGQRALQILQEHPEVTALYATTEVDSIGVAQAVESFESRQVLVVGWRTEQGWDRASLSGVIRVSMVEDPQAMGRTAVEVLEAYLRRDVRPDREVFIPVTVKSGGGRR